MDTFITAQRTKDKLINSSIFSIKKNSGNDLLTHNIQTLELSEFLAGKINFPKMKTSNMNQYALLMSECDAHMKVKK